MTQKVSTDTSIALIHKDIGFIKDSMTKIAETLALMERDFLKRVEFDTFRRELEKKDDIQQVIIDKHTQTISTQELNFTNFKTQVQTWGIIGGVGLTIGTSVITAFIIKLAV